MTVDLTPREGDSLLSCPHVDDVPEGEIAYWYRLNEPYTVELDSGVNIDVDFAWVELCGACRDRHLEGEPILKLVSDLATLTEDVTGIDPELGR